MKIIGIVLKAPHVKNPGYGFTKDFIVSSALWFGQKNSFFITLDRPQSQAPPPPDISMLMSWPVWSAAKKHSEHSDIEGRKPQSRQRNINAFLDHTAMQAEVCSYLEWIFLRFVNSGGSRFGYGKFK